MTKLTLIDDNTDEVLRLTKSEARDLELKLNVTKYGKKWKDIGDTLYNFHAEKGKTKDTLTVTTEQLEFLKQLHMTPRDAKKNKVSGVLFDADIAHQDQC